MIDLYCERTAPGFWNEPLNALTNIAFFCAALAILYLAQRTDRLWFSVVLLAGLCAAIGTGSFLFHTYATAWAELADIIPILLFQITYLCLYGCQVMRLPLPGVALLLGGFFGATWVAGLEPQLLNGSIAYLPAILFIIGLGIYHVCRQQTERWTLLMAGVVFLLSLTFRSIDIALCGPLPRGTHFLWHLFNGVVLFLVSRTYLLNLPRKQSAP